MKPSAFQPIQQTRIIPQQFNWLARVVIVILLAAARFAWVPATTVQAASGALTGSGCGDALYWEYFFAQAPDSSQIDRPACAPAAGKVTGPGLGSSLYWEVFLARQSDGSQAAAQAAVPVTGQAAYPASLYWEYFLVYSPNGPQIAAFGSEPVTSAAPLP